jgi:hypothetical protein
MQMERVALPPIDIEPSAAAHIRAHGGHIMLRRSPRHGCCGGRVFLAVVDLGQPVDPAGYLLVAQDELFIHLDRTLLAAQATPLTIGLSKWWRWTELWVDGAEVSM